MDTYSPTFAPRVVILEWDRLYGDMIRSHVWNIWPEASVRVFQHGFDALASIQQTVPDLFVTGAVIDDMDGVEHLEHFIDTSLPILIVLSHTDTRTMNLLRTIRYEGLYDRRSEGLDNLSTVLRQVIQRRVYVSPIFLPHLKPRKNITLDTLTPTEEVVLSVIGDGSTNEEASSRLGVSPLTVASHRRAIMRKLGLHQVTHLMRYALKEGYVRMTPDGVYYPGFQRKFQSKQESPDADAKKNGEAAREGQAETTAPCK